MLGEKAGAALDLTDLARATGRQGEAGADAVAIALGSHKLTSSHRLSLPEFLSKTGG